MVKQILSSNIRSVTQGTKKTIKKCINSSVVLFCLSIFSQQCFCMEAAGQVIVRDAQNCGLGQNTSGCIASTERLVEVATEEAILEDQRIHNAFKEIEHASFEQLVQFMMQKIVDLQQEEALIAQPSKEWSLLDSCLPDLHDLIVVVLLSFLQQVDCNKEYKCSQDYNIAIQPICFYTLHYMRLIHSILLVGGRHKYPITQNNVRRLFLTCFHLAVGMVDDDEYYVMPFNNQSNTLSMSAREDTRKIFYAEHPQIYALLKLFVKGKIELVSVFFYDQRALKIPLADVTRLAQEFKCSLIA